MSVFHCSHAPFIQQQLITNILWFIVFRYSEIFQSIFRYFKITRCTARLLDCMPSASEVSLRMLVQGRNRNKMNQQIKKAGLDNNNNYHKGNMHKSYIF